MKVILLKEVPGLGQAGAVKDVKEGHARNYLLPRGLAVEATEGNLRALQGQQQVRAERAQRERTEAEHLTQTLEQVVIEISGRGGDSGRLFGSITAQDVAEALHRRGFPVTKKQVELPDPIKVAGFYKIAVRIGAGRVAHVDVNVVATK